MIFETIFANVVLLLSFLIQTTVSLFNTDLYPSDLEGTPAREAIENAIEHIEAEEPGLFETEPTPDYFFVPVNPDAQVFETPTVLPETGPTEPAAPLFSEVFQNGSTSFGIPAQGYEDEDIRINTANSVLNLVPKRNNGWTTWRLRPPLLTDAAAEMSFMFISCDAADKSGVILRAPDYESGDGYYFTIDCSGKAAINLGGQQLVSGDALPFMQTNPFKSNTLRAEAKGSRLTLLLNGEKICETEDETLPSGFSGFFTAPFGNETLRLQISKFEIFGL